MLFIELFTIAQIVAVVAIVWFGVKFYLRHRHKALQHQQQREFSARHHGQAASKKIERQNRDY